MAKVLEFKGQRVEFDAGARAMMLEEAIVGASEKNARSEIASIAIIAIDYGGIPHTWKVWEPDTGLDFLGAIEVLKAEMLARVLERRLSEALGDD